MILLLACIAGPDPTDSGEVPDDSDVEGLAVAGDWLDVDSGLYVITNESWRYQAFEDTWSDDEILSYDNGLGYVIAQNDPVHEPNPGLFSRYDFESVGGFWQVCHATDEAESAEAAEAASAPEDCPWIELIPAI